ncbi:MAG: acetate--CoA ligase [Sumerlaeia bacterium]
MTEAVVFDDLLHENREFPPSDEFRKNAIVSDKSLYEKGKADFEGYWESEAHELEWFEPWNKVLNWNPPHCEWFTGGKINITHNCIDRHLKGPRRNKAALIWEGEDFEVKTLTYLQLHREVCKFGNAMKNHGVRKGDRVAIYMPMIPEAAIAMLACARIGAIHSVVFGGFSAESLCDRIQDAQCKMLITADGGWRRGGIVQLKSMADKALDKCPSIETVVVVKRPHGDPFPCHIQEGRDVWYHRIMQDATADCPAEPMDAEDPLFILYTSGTTGKPKGIVHTCGGYSVGTYSTTKYVFDLKEDDIYWCTADVGWITGHSYIVYGPLQCGATCLLYEGAPNWPENDRFWDICERHGVTVFYTAPTAIRAFMKWGHQLTEKYDLGALRLLGSVGEPINPEAWMWYHKWIGREKCPIVDTWWQTETGSIMISTLPGADIARPGSAGFAMPGIHAKILAESGKEVEAGSGLLAITKPWPSMLRTIWGDDERYVNTYFSKWDNSNYFPGDGAKVDAKGYFTVLGRVDDVLNVSGHRIGTAEIESALVEHEATAEAAVVGRKDDLKGQAIVAFVTLKQRFQQSDELRKELREFVKEKIGAIARPDDLIFSADLPKTRSGKIMRRLLRDIAEGRALGDTTTLADPSIVQQLRESYEEKYGD